MLALKLFNSLTKKTEKFIPLNPPDVGIYTCGPTVYDYVSIGNWRSYILGDLVLRSLKMFGFVPTYIINITDVGHLTGDNLGDADLGEDRMEKAALKQGKTAWDIASFYEVDFLNSFKKLNLLPPKKFTKATDHIQEQIALISKIETKGFTYKITDGIYFNVSLYEKKGNVYGELSTLDKIEKGARIKKNLEKKDQRDFALWKFSPKNTKRQMEWDSPWGKGFPGWHIECSAMSMKYLGEQFDIHLGGEDLKSTHHPNEIAQSQSVTGKKPFVKYWIHGAFLQVDGGRMGKSLGNAYTLQDLEKKGFDPLALRYFYLTCHYRKQLNFTWKALKAAQKNFNNLTVFVAALLKENSNSKTAELSPEKLALTDNLRHEFLKSLSMDFNFPQALAVVFKVIKSDLPSKDKYDLLMFFDEALGLDLQNIKPKNEKYLKPDKEIKLLLLKRESFRKAKKFAKADELRKQIEAKGYIIKDSSSGSKLALKER
ncbi:cysteine--tRNA ligase [Patescibacteria group bacterium]